MNAEQQLKELKELLSKRYNKDFSEEEVKEHCVAIIYNGIVNKGWSLNGVKFDEFTK